MSEVLFQFPKLCMGQQISYTVQLAGELSGEVVYHERVNSEYKGDSVVLFNSSILSLQDGNYAAMVYLKAGGQNASSPSLKLSLLSQSKLVQWITTSIYVLSQSRVALWIGMDGSLCLYIRNLEFTLSLSVIIHLWHHKMIAKVNMYVYLKFGENWTTNKRDMAIQFLLLFLFFGLNLSISKTVRGTGLKFWTQVGSDDPTCSDLSKCSKTM